MYQPPASAMSGSNFPSTLGPSLILDHAQRLAVVRFNASCVPSKKRCCMLYSSGFSRNFCVRRRKDKEGRLRKALLVFDNKSIQSWPNQISAVLESSSSTSLHMELPVSIVIPVYNEAATITMLVDRVAAVMRKRGGPYEIICVDDGSEDGSTSLLKAMAAERDDLSAIIFCRNFGQTAAIAAGFDMATGELIVTLDGDLQNDADDIPKLIDQLLYGNAGGKALPTGAARSDRGFDMVCGWRRNRKDNIFTRNIPSMVANWLIGRVTGIKLHDYGCSLKAFRTTLVKKLRLYGEMHRFLPALAAAEGATIAEIEVQHHPRTLGKSKYGLNRVPRVLLDLLTVLFWTKFRDRPMQFIGSLGAICVIAAIVALIFASCFLISASKVWGWGMAFTSAVPNFILAVELFIMGIQLICLGLLSEICMRTYFESQPRPVYHVREVAIATK